MSSLNILEVFSNPSEVSLSRAFPTKFEMPLRSRPDRLDMALIEAFISLSLSFGSSHVKLCPSSYLPTYLRTYVPPRLALKSAVGS